MILDFQEIPQANKGSGLQDSFELFSRDFFEILGFEIIQHPDRGADGKKDLIIQESRPGITGVSKVRWLVSCKHFAHSKKAVSDTDEPDISDRLKAHNCDGFIGFYSTLPASSLNNKLNGGKFQFEIFDKGRIEKMLLDTPKGNTLARRFFPISHQNYKRENPSPSEVFVGEKSIKCEYCKKDLLADRSGIYALLKPLFSEEGDNTVLRSEKYADIYFSCKGEHDYILKNRYRELHGLFDESWSDITDLMSPTTWLSKLIAFMNEMQRNQNLEERAYLKMRYMFMETFPYIARELTDKEKENISMLIRIGRI
jgi:hypothetical protein